MSGHNVLAVANEFIDRAEKAGRLVTPMHLQKFCYMAHGYSLALLDDALIKDPVEAWDYGPVYPPLYDALKAHGSGPVPRSITKNNWALLDRIRGSEIRERFSDDESQLLDEIWKVYGNFKAFQLSALTHEPDSPWAKVYKAGVKGIRIPDAMIKDYFSGLARVAA